MPFAHSSGLGVSWEERADMTKSLCSRSVPGAVGARILRILSMQGRGGGRWAWPCGPLHPQSGDDQSGPEWMATERVDQHRASSCPGLQGVLVFESCTTQLEVLVSERKNRFHQSKLSSMKSSGISFTDSQLFWSLAAYIGFQTCSFFVSTC